MTITDAIKAVMIESGSAMTVSEAYHAILTANLYEFHSDNPKQIVRTQIRRHCEGLDFPSANPTKYFKLAGENKYTTICGSLTTPSRSHNIQKVCTDNRPLTQPGNSLRDLLDLHAQYVEDLKEKILSDLKILSPATFESFAKQLLDAYGFHDTKVTQISGDGGIDGHGKLKVGLANLNVAFQCKRWTKGNIQRTEIDKFRGAIQGDFEQGIFFTTTTFSNGSIGASIKKGAVPIVLIDGKAIVSLMFEKNLGIQSEILSIPSYALDIVLSEN